MKRLRGKLTLTCAHRYVGDVCWSQGAVLSAESRDVSDSTGMFVRNVESKDAIAASKGQAAPVPPKRVVGLHYVLRFCVLKLPNQNLCFEIVWNRFWEKKNYFKSCLLPWFRLCVSTFIWSGQNFSQTMFYKDKTFANESNWKVYPLHHVCIRVYSVEIII